MLGTFGLRPKGTMSARALGLASALRDHGWRAGIATVPWDFPADAGSSGMVNGIEFRNTHTVRPLLWPLPVAELVREADRFQPDLIHLFKPKGFGDLAARLLRRRGYRVVVDMDDWEGYGGWNDALPYSRLQRAVFDWQERTWPQQANAVTVASRTLQQRALDLGAPDDDVGYLPNGLARERFEQLASPRSLRNGDGVSSNVGKAKILLYTRFVEFDPSFVVEILSRLAGDHPATSLVVAGGSHDGSAEVQLMSSARKAGLADRIEWLGWIQAEKLGEIASQCRVALIPFEDTLINRAKCSVKTLELMATGLPVVASAVGENRHYLHGGRYGYLARPGDADSHASGIREAFSREENDARQSGGITSRYVQRNFLWERLVHDVLASYRTALKKM